MRAAIEEENDDRRELLTVALREVLVDALGPALKEIVEEAVRDAREETADGDGGARRGRGVLLLVVGAALGYLAARAVADAASDT